MGLPIGRRGTRSAFSAADRFSTSSHRVPLRKPLRRPAPPLGVDRRRQSPIEGPPRGQYVQTMIIQSKDSYVAFSGGIPSQRRTYGAHVDERPGRAYIDSPLFSYDPRFL